MKEEKLKNLIIFLYISLVFFSFLVIYLVLEMDKSTKQNTIKNDSMKTVIDSLQEELNWQEYLNSTYRKDL